MSSNTVEFSVPWLPPSLNTGTRGRGIAAHRAKKKMEEQLVWALIGAKVPRGLAHVTATASLRFPTNHRRDPDNYGWLLGKALGDALAPHSPLAPHRWLPDDTAEFFAFVTPVTFEPKGPARTTIRLEWR